MRSANFRQRYSWAVAWLPECAKMSRWMYDEQHNRICEEGPDFPP